MSQRKGQRDALALAALGLPLVAFYLFCSLGLSKGVDVTRFPNGIYDFDSRRVVIDWTMPLRGWRMHIHPLYKLWSAPVGIPLNRFATEYGATHAAPENQLGPRPVKGFGKLVTGGALAATRIMIAFYMTAYVLLTGWLTRQLAGGGLGPAIGGALICAVSFSSILLGSVPDAASMSGLSTLAPLIYLNRRLGRDFTWGESFTWGFLGMFCIAFTISQVMHWAIAVGVRCAVALHGREASIWTLFGRAAARFAALAALAAVITVATFQFQSWLYPGQQLELEKIRQENVFLRTDDLIERPATHLIRLARHFVGYNFVAPFPTYTDVFIKMYKFVKVDAWSLSLEDVGLAEMHPLQLTLTLLVTLAVVPGIVGLWRASLLFLAPLLCIGGQFALHLVYGREYILYSPNWHGVVVAVLVAAAWRRFESQRRALTAVWSALILAMLVNNVAVLERTYEEVRVGLWVSLRDSNGALLPDARTLRPGGR